MPVEVTLTQIQWTSVRRAEGNGFYTWDSERKLVPGGQVDGDDSHRSSAAEDPVRALAATSSSKRPDGVRMGASR